jgi:hypothetical protein
MESTSRHVVPPKSSDLLSGPHGVAGFSTLREFQSDFPAAQVLFLHRGERRLSVNGVMCAPCDGFLAELNPKRNAPFG